MDHEIETRELGELNGSQPFQTILKSFNDKSIGPSPYDLRYENRLLLQYFS